jgi:hypothetical protein
MILILPGGPFNPFPSTRTTEPHEREGGKETEISRFCPSGMKLFGHQLSKDFIDSAAFLTLLLLTSLYSN